MGYLHVLLCRVGETIERVALPLIERFWFCVGDVMRLKVSEMIFLSGLEEETIPPIALKAIVSRPPSGGAGWKAV